MLHATLSAGCWRWLWGTMLAVVVAMAPARARAAPASLGSFGYEAPAACPSRAAFSAQVAARTKGWLAPSSPFAVTVSIDARPPDFFGRLTFARGEQRTVRQLRASGCGELVDALAFIVAVLIDPQASSTLPAPEQRRPPPVYLLSSPESPPLEAHVWFSGGPEAGLDTAMTGNSAFTERFFVGVGRGDGSLALSSARLSLARAVDHLSSPLSGNRADFKLETARLDGCLLRVTRGELAVETCPFVELGRLRAVGNHRQGNVTDREFWSAVGLILRPSWTFSRRLVLGVGMGTKLVLSRYRFAFTGEPELAATPAVAFEATLHVGLRFP